MTLLLLEDDENLCRMLSAALKLNGWDVVTAYRLSDAMETLAQCRFSAVLVDLTLPDSSWQNTLAQLPEVMKKAWPARVIVSTGTAPDDCQVPAGVRVLRKSEEGSLSKLLAVIGDSTPV